MATKTRNKNKDRRRDRQRHQSEMRHRQRDEAARILAKHGSRVKAARAAGCSGAVLEDWLARDPDFRALIEKHTAELAEDLARRFRPRGG